MQKPKMFRRWLPGDQFLAIGSFQDFQKIAGNKGLKIKVPGGGQIKKSHYDGWMLGTFPAVPDPPTSNPRVCPSLSPCPSP